MAGIDRSFMGGPAAAGALMHVLSPEQRAQQEAMMRKQEHLIVADRCIALLSSEPFAKLAADATGQVGDDARAVQTKAANLLRIWFDGVQVVDTPE